MIQRRPGIRPGRRPRSPAPCPRPPSQISRSRLRLLDGRRPGGGPRGPRPGLAAAGRCPGGRGLIHAHSDSSVFGVFWWESSHSLRLMGVFSITSYCCTLFMTNLSACVTRALRIDPLPRRRLALRPAFRSRPACDATWHGVYGGHSFFSTSRAISSLEPRPEESADSRSGPGGGC